MIHGPRDDPLCCPFLFYTPSRTPAEFYIIEVIFLSHSIQIFVCVYCTGFDQVHDKNGQSKHSTISKEMAGNEKGHEFHAARERVAASIGSSDSKEKSVMFDEWASVYDDDMIALGYRGYEAMGKRITQLVPNKDVKILDLGCGTGRMGGELRSLGYSNVYGVDASDSFLKESRNREVYVDLKNSRFGANIKAPYDDGSFDVVMAVSVFGPGTIDHTALSEINRIITSGGYFMAFMRRSRLDMEREDFNVKGVFEEWVASGQWERLSDVNAIYYGNTHGVEKGDKAVENTGVVVTLRKLFI